MRLLRHIVVPLYLLILALLAACDEKSTAAVLNIKSAAAVDCVFVTLESGDTKVKEVTVDLRQPPHSDKDWLRPFEPDGLPRDITLPVLVYSSNAFQNGRFTASVYGRLGGCEASDPITSTAGSESVTFEKDQ